MSRTAEPASCNRCGRCKPKANQRRRAFNFAHGDGHRCVARSHCQVVVKLAGRRYVARLAHGSNPLLDLFKNKALGKEAKEAVLV